jgi:hypothetical protein
MLCMTRMGEGVVGLGRSQRQILVGLPAAAWRCTAIHEHEVRQTVYGGQIIGAKIRAESGRKRAVEATREADRATRDVWSIHAAIPKYRLVSQRRVRLARCWVPSLQERAFRSTRSGVHVIPQSGKLEAALKCRSCRTPRYSPPVHMINLTETREITPYVWVHPDEER